MFCFIWTASIYTQHLLRRYLPTNILSGAIRTRRGLKWGVPAMLLAIPYLLIARICMDLLAAGAPGWLNLVILLCLWNALIFLITGPGSLALLVRARDRERRTGENFGVPRMPAAPGYNEFVYTDREAHGAR